MIPRARTNLEYDKSRETCVAQTLRENGRGRRRRRLGEQLLRGLVVVGVGAVLPDAHVADVLQRPGLQGHGVPSRHGNVHHFKTLTKKRR